MFKKLLIILLLVLSFSIETKALTLEQGNATLQDGWSWFSLGNNSGHYLYMHDFIPFELGDLRIQFPNNQLFQEQRMINGIQYYSYMQIYSDNMRLRATIRFDQLTGDFPFEEHGLLTIIDAQVNICDYFGLAPANCAFWRLEMLHPYSNAPFGNYLEWWSNRFFYSWDEDIIITEFGVNTVRYHLFNNIYYEVPYNIIPDRPIDPIMVPNRTFKCWETKEGVCYNFDEQLEQDYTTDYANLFATFLKTETPTATIPNNPVDNITNLLTGLGLMNTAGKLFLYVGFVLVAVLGTLALKLPTMAIFITVGAVTIMFTFLGFIEFWALILITLGFAVTFTYALKEV